MGGTRDNISCSSRHLCCRLQMSKRRSLHVSANLERRPRAATIPRKRSMKRTKDDVKRMFFAVSMVTLSLISPKLEAQPINVYLYIYNECRSTIDVNASFYLFGQSKKQSSKTSVRSGTQEMVAVSNRGTLEMEASTEARVWDKIEFNSSIAEYIHVLSCSCFGSDCPSTWPGSALTRQYAKYEAEEDPGSLIART